MNKNKNAKGKIVFLPVFQRSLFSLIVPPSKPVCVRTEIESKNKGHQISSHCNSIGGMTFYIVLPDRQQEYGLFRPNYSRGSTIYNLNVAKHRP